MQLINSCGEFAVAVGDGIAGVVSAQMDLHLVVHVAPIGMVVVFLCQKGHTCHERKGFGEVFKNESAAHLIVLFYPHGSSFLFNDTDTEHIGS